MYKYVMITKELYVFCAQHGNILYSVLLLLHVLNLTNRFRVAMRLFSKISQMTSKFGKNKKVANKVLAECVTDVFTTF